MSSARRLERLEAAEFSQLRQWERLRKAVLCERDARDGHAAFQAAKWMFDLTPTEVVDRLGPLLLEQQHHQHDRYLVNVLTPPPGWNEGHVINNALLSVLCCYWAQEIFCGPDGGDWGWRYVLPMRYWPRPLRVAWERVCTRETQESNA